MVLFKILTIVNLEKLWKLMLEVLALLLPLGESC